MIANMIKDLKSDLRKFKKTYISHMFWEAKSVVDWFANDVVNKNLEMNWKICDGLLKMVIEFI